MSLGSLLPWWARLGLLAALGLACYAAGRAHQIRADHAADTERALATSRQVEQVLHGRIRAANTAAAAHEADQARIRTVYQTITREVAHVVDRPVYRDCRLDPDGVRLLNAALAADATAAAPGQPPDPVPRAAPAR